MHSTVLVKNNYYEKEKEELSSDFVLLIVMQINQGTLVSCIFYKQRVEAEKRKSSFVNQGLIFVEIHKISL